MLLYCFIQFQIIRMNNFLGDIVYIVTTSTFKEDSI